MFSISQRMVQNFQKVTWKNTTSDKEQIHLHYKYGNELIKGENKRFNEEQRQRRHKSYDPDFEKP